MKNYERYIDEIRAYAGTNFCNDFIKPHIINSPSCDGVNCAACRMLQMAWLLEEYEEPREPAVDWDNVAVDTPILVKNAEHENWRRRYFAAYKDGVIYAWVSGKTS